MPAQSIQTEAFVLLHQPPAESFQTLSVFSPEHGNLTVLQRVAKKSAASLVTLDLFDEASLQLETSNQGRTYFVKEARLLARHVAIGRSYETLRWASALTRLIARNPVSEESRGSVGSLLRRALAAFESSERPDIVYLKSLYRFARDEGYPVKEQWFPTLPASDRAALSRLLNRPLAEQTADAEQVARFRRRLDEYLLGHTDIVVDFK